MTERATRRGQLGRVQRKLWSWRERHGGRGRPIPEELWTAAAEVAAIEGVNATARALALDRERLARRVERSVGPVVVPSETALSRTAFVELDTRGVFARGQTVVRLTSRDGEQLEIAVDGGALDVAAVARAFWERSR